MVVLFGVNERIRDHQHHWEEKLQLSFVQQKNTKIPFSSDFEIDRMFYLDSNDHIWNGEMASCG